MCRSPPCAAEVTARRAVDESVSDLVELTVTRSRATRVAQPSTLAPNGANARTVTIQLKDPDGATSRPAGTT